MSTTPPPPTTLPVPSTLLPAPKPLDTSDDAWLGWRTWKSEFELFATATQLTKQPTDVQAATFLVSIGEEGRKAFSTFKFDADEDRNDVKVLIKKFEDYYKPANNLTLHEFRFGSRDQKEGEPFNDWLIELKILAKNCEFGLLEDRMLRSRIVLGVQDKRLQQKLLAENPSYQKTVEICRIEEQGKQHFQEISAATGGAQTTIVNSVAREKKLCSRCGYQMHLGGNCPARGKNCTKCGAQNHFAQVCKSVGATHNASRPGKELREVRAETDDFFLEGLAINSLEVDKWTATVYIEGQPVTCKLDTGANCCVISKNELERLPAKPKEACKVTLTAFFGHRTTAQAKVKLLLYANNKKCEEQFFVVEHDLPVTLSGAVAERLGFIYRIQKVSSEELYRPAQPFADVFSGLGQLKGVEYSMKLKPGSAGTVVPARRVPIALQDKVLAELQRMEQQGVITKAEVHYLGHILTTQGLRIDPERVQDILEIPEPKTKTAWPEHKHGVPEPGRPYCREEVHAQDGLVFRSNKVIIPKSKRAEIMQLLHAAHAGADKMKARASSVMFWPNMSADINQFCKTCKVCQMHQPRNQKMPLLSHDVPTLPWESVGVDLFHYGGREFAVMVDFYSFFFEVRELRHTTSNALKTWCAQVFLVHGLPQKLYSDNGPPFSSSDFLRKLDVVHVTSSPYHPRSNGMAERAVQEAKKLLKKCSFRTPDFEIALLEWRNTPRDPVLKSPVQRLMGRQTRTLLPVPTIHLEPEAIPSKEVHDRLQTIRRRQKIHYDRSARNLSPLTPGQRVTTYDTLQRTWAPAIVLRPAATPRSTIVKTEDGHEIRRTREHLREAAPQPEPESTSQGPSEDDLQSGQQQLRRSTRLRREPCRYPLPDETSRPYHH
ncbi:uncharacterized protein [Dermacentor andersoni]|uniref:uncharacterized protein isoform X2 n=1 Tax=Dermacentor andersoni TaxID=34620 RepID=UPI002418005A|nr:uncharacterized protein LOC126546920 isoform X2 [Dermacentor andersoni]